MIHAMVLWFILGFLLGVAFVPLVALAIGAALLCYVALDLSSFENNE